MNIPDGQSTDLHLFIQPPLGSSVNVGNSVTIRLKPVNQLATDTTPSSATTPTYTLEKLSYAFDYNGDSNRQNIGQQSITPTFEADRENVYVTFTLTAAAQVCETYCRIIYQGPNNVYLETIVRLTVHERLLRYWIGNSRITLLNSLPAADKIDYRKIRVYAECDNGAFGKGPADLTGNSYLTYGGVTANISVESFTLPKATPTAPTRTIQQGHLKAVFPTYTSTTPLYQTDVSVLFGNTPPSGAPTVPIYVVAIGGPDSRAVLRRFHIGRNPDTARKHKILFLPEGYTDQADVEGWLALIKKELTTSKFHTPFDLLADDYDLWTVDLPSYDDQPGITLESPLSVDGWLVPSYPILLYKQKDVDNASSKGVATIVELLRAVGIPSLDAPATLALALPMWQNLPEFVKLQRTRTISEDLFAAWSMQTPSTFIYAKDTVFGVVKGTESPRVVEKHALHRGDWAAASPPYIPHEEPQRKINYSLKDRLTELLASFTTKDEAVDPKISGSVWAVESADKKAAGLVCMFVKDPTSGGGSFPYNPLPNSISESFFTSFFSAGGEFNYKYVKNTAQPLTNLDFSASLLNPKKLMPAQRGVGVLVHEMGHLLGLGDEYGNIYRKHEGKLDELTQADVYDVDRYANIISYNELHALDPSITYTAGAANWEEPGKLAVPEKLRWNWDRVACSSLLLTAPSPVNNTTNTFTIRLEVDTQNWVGQKGATIVLRSGTLVPGPRDPNVLCPCTITDVKLVPEVDTPYAPAYYELTLSGSAPGIGAKDVAYIPRTYADGTPMRLIAKQVENVMKTKSFKATPDRQHTQNYDAADAATQNAEPASADFVKAMKTEISLLRQAGEKLSSKVNPQNIIAIYEGAGEYEILAYRSNGYSKMRSASQRTVGEGDVQVYNELGYPKTDPLTGKPITQHVSVDETVIAQFNYVSQYYLVNKINPTKLAALDESYNNQAR